MLTKLLFGESGTHTGERCLLLLTPCYFVPRLTLLARYPASLGFPVMHHVIFQPLLPIMPRIIVQCQDMGQS